MSETQNKFIAYTGEALKEKPSEPLPIWEYEFLFNGKIFDKIKPTKKEQTETIDPYIPDPELIEAIELMRILERPLLLRGEPGCGKTKVAQAVAYELYKDEEDYKRYYFEWHVKSSSKAQDGLYTFDHIARLREAHKPQKNGTPDAATGSKDQGTLPEEDLVKYRKLGPLGQAFLASEPDKPAILLIDEIDKADIDFPNDLLLELDQMRFSIPETGEEIIPKRRPLIFITSNQERELPQAFLRRCLFHFIDFPKHSQLTDIIKSNFKEWFDKLEKNKKKEEPTFITEAITRFEELRAKLKANPTVNKNLSTSELKDWMRLLEHHHKIGHKDKISLENGNTPFLAALIKTENDRKSLGLNTR